VQTHVIAHSIWPQVKKPPHVVVPAQVAAWHVLVPGQVTAPWQECVSQHVGA
jgi:hypothetical protein